MRGSYFYEWLFGAFEKRTPQNRKPKRRELVPCGEFKVARPRAVSCKAARLSVKCAPK